TPGVPVGSYVLYLFLRVKRSHAERAPNWCWIFRSAAVQGRPRRDLRDPANSHGRHFTPVLAAGSPPAGSPPSRGTTGKELPMAVPTVTMHQLIEAGAHFGHQTHRWNPPMKPYIFGSRN